MAQHSRHETAARRRRRDERGGAVSLLVILMVPVCVFAAIAATAVPKRLAARSAADAAASDLASLAVAWRDAQGRDHDAIGWFFDDCAPIERADEGFAHDEPSDKQADAASLPSETAAGGEQGRDIRHACETLTASLLAGLSVRGFDASSVAGFYSSAYTTAAQEASVHKHTVIVPCRSGGDAVVGDAVYLALSAEWASGDWAAAQLWPDGITIGAEAVGRITHSGTDKDAVAECGELFDTAPLESQTRLGDQARSAAWSLPTHVAFGRRP